MAGTKTKDGVANMLKSGKGLDMDAVKVLKTQDLGYVTMKRMAEKTKVDRLGSTLHFVGEHRARDAPALRASILSSLLSPPLFRGPPALCFLSLPASVLRGGGSCGWRGCDDDKPTSKSLRQRGAWRPLVHPLKKGVIEMSIQTPDFRSNLTTTAAPRPLSASLPGVHRPLDAPTNPFHKPPRSRHAHGTSAPSPRPPTWQPAAACLARAQRWYRAAASGAAKPREHIVFVDSEQEAESFDVAEHFNTAPELVERHYNRPTLEQLAEREYAAPTQRELNKLEKAKARQYQQLAERQSREEKLSGWMVDMGMQTQLMGACVRACVRACVLGHQVVAYQWQCAYRHIFHFPHTLPSAEAMAT
jgi:hypothetical protein